MIPGTPRRAVVLLLLVSSWLVGPEARRSIASAAEAPAAITDQSRNDQIDDFLRELVTILYRALLARDPDAGGRESQERLWTEGLLQAVVSRLIGSREFRQLRPQLCQG